MLATNPGDRSHCLEAFKGHQNVFLTDANSPELDLAILASCNHTIYDYGTFGMWYVARVRTHLSLYYGLSSTKRAGILAGGKVIHANGYCPENKRIETSELAMSEHFSGWKTLNAQTFEQLL